MTEEETCQGQNMILKVPDKLAYNKIIFVMEKHPLLLAHNKFDI